MTSAAQITDSCTYHGEGPVWDPRRGRLLFVDMLAGDVLALDPAGGVARHPVGSVAAVVRSREQGGFVVAVERGFVFADEDFAVLTPVAEAFDDPALRLNEGGCDPQGRFYCGSMAYDMAKGAGSLYRLDPDRTVRPVLTGVTISNGLQWSSDGGTAFYNDTETGRVDALDFDSGSGTFSNRRPFAGINADKGAPDGMAIDAEDGIWVALYGGAAVHRYDAAGKLTEVVTVPPTNVTACAFGGPDGRTLYITTSREGLAPDEQPAAGAVFAADVGISGAPLHRFAG